MSNQPFYTRIERGITSAKRLQHLRALVANHEAATWRGARAWKLNNWEAAYLTLNQGFNSSDNGPAAPARPVWYCHTGPQFRNEQYADEIECAHIDHEGWFTDAHQEDKIRGIVANLTHGRYISGYESSDNGERVYFDRVYESAKEAARDADHEAERAAEAEREYSEDWTAANNIRADIDDALRQIREKFALRNRPGFSYLRREVSPLIENVRDFREQLERDYKHIDLGQ